MKLFLRTCFPNVYNRVVKPAIVRGPLLGSVSVTIVCILVTEPYFDRLGMLLKLLGAIFVPNVYLLCLFESFVWAN